MTDDPVRERLLKGLHRAIEERGYRETTIADIVRHARASRSTFYQVYATKDESLLALMEAANGALMRRIVTAVDPAAPWPAQTRQAVLAYIAHVTASPELSLCWIREFPSLGPVAGRVRRDTMNALADLVQRLTGNEPFRRAGIAPVSRELALVILGGLRELTATVLEEGGDVRDVAETGIAAAVALLGAGRAPERPAKTSTGLLLTDDQWARIRPLLPAARSAVGRPPAPQRQVVEAIIYRDHTGIAWRELPPRFGAWQTAWKRHRRWSEDGTWDRVLSRLQETGQPDHPDPVAGVQLSPAGVGGEVDLNEDLVGEEVRAGAEDSRLAR
ncbi:transposase [Asanoa sp. NPDC049518]|uniref:transposase n=1 Tax=unclassified Asanoa TaxID=2685164 RepID=UPI003447DA4A